MPIEANETLDLAKAARKAAERGLMVAVDFSPWGMRECVMAGAILMC